MKYGFTVHADNCAIENICQVAGTLEVKSYGNGVFSFRRDLSVDDRDRMLRDLMEIGSVTHVDVRR